MPTVTRWHLRTALVFLVLAFATGMLLFMTGCTPPSELTPSTDLHVPPEITPSETDLVQPGTQAIPSWTFHLSGAVNVTPLVSHDLIVTATADGVVHAVQALTGEPAWEFSPAAKVWDASLSVDEDLVCAGLVGGEVACLQAATGEVAWTVELGIEVQSPMVLTGDRVYVPSTHVGTGLENNYEGRASLFALDRRNGALIWEVETGNYILRRPLAADDLVVAGGLFLNEADEGINRLYAFQADSGDVVWEHESNDGLLRWIERAGDVLLFAGHSETVQALDLATGAPLWNYGPGYWIQFPAIQDGILYFGTGDHFMQALRAASGEVVWEQAINMDALNQVGRPLLADGRLWFNSVTGEIYGFDIASGQEFLHLITGHTARVGGARFENFYIMGDPDGFLYAYVIK